MIMGVATRVMGHAPPPLQPQKFRPSENFCLDPLRKSTKNCEKFSLHAQIFTSNKWCPPGFGVPTPRIPGLATPICVIQPVPWTFQDQIVHLMTSKQIREACYFASKKCKQFNEETLLKLLQRYIKLRPPCSRSASSSSSSSEESSSDSEDQIRIELAETDSPESIAD